MRIGIDMRPLVDCKAGFYRYVLELIKAMKKVASDNTYICYIDKRTELLGNCELRKAWGSVENHILGDFWEQVKLPLELYKEKIDVYHGTIGRLPRLRRKVKYVVTILDLNPLKFGEFYSRTFNWYMSLMLKQSAKVANRVIAISNHTKSEIIELLNVPEEKIKVIYCGLSKHWKPVDFEKYYPIIRKRYSIQTPYILTVANIEPKKNLPRLFSAYSILQKKRKIKEQLVIAGPAEGWKAKNIIDCAGKLNDVVFTGCLSDDNLRVLYSGARLFILPSLHEGFGLPLLEAMACGAPVAASNVAAIPEITGSAAILFDPTNVEEIAEAIEKVIDNEELRKELIAKGFNRAKSFSWEKTAKETLKLYAETLTIGG